MRGSIRSVEPYGGDISVGGIAGFETLFLTVVGGFTFKTGGFTTGACGGKLRLYCFMSFFISFAGSQYGISQMQSSVWKRVSG